MTDMQSLKACRGGGRRNESSVSVKMAKMEVSVFGKSSREKVMSPGMLSAFCWDGYLAAEN